MRILPRRCIRDKAMASGSVLKRGAYSSSACATDRGFNRSSGPCCTRSSATAQVRRWRLCVACKKQRNALHFGRQCIAQLAPWGGAARSDTGCSEARDDLGA